MCARVFVPDRERLCCPVPERVVELTVHQVTHVDCADRLVILHVVHLVEISAPISLCDSWKPRLTPSASGILENLIALALDSGRDVQRLIQSGQRFTAVCLPSRNLSRL